MKNAAAVRRKLVPDQRSSGIPGDPVASDAEKYQFTEHASVLLNAVRKQRRQLFAGAAASLIDVVNFGVFFSKHDRYLPFRRIIHSLTVYGINYSCSEKNMTCPPVQKNGKTVGKNRDSPAPKRSFSRNIRDKVGKKG